MDTAIDLDFADGSYHFWLAFPQVIELQRKCGWRLPDGSTKPKPIFQIYDELSDGIGLSVEDDSPQFRGQSTANAEDIAEVIRLGLIGGGQTPLDAKATVENYVHTRPLAESLPVAWAVLNAAIVGIDTKKKVAENQADEEAMSQSEKEQS